ncbi:MAG: hypothetical protein ACXITV_01645 [Luteibaculaceae bacterium]
MNLTQHIVKRTVKTVALALALVAVGSAGNKTYAQQEPAWVEPLVMNPNAPATFYVDVQRAADQRLFNAPGYQSFIDGVTAGESLPSPVFIWTWNPAETRPTGNGNGDWTNSNEALRMTYAPDRGTHVFSFTFVPTEFYGVDAARVFEVGFSFLAKLRDGTAGAGGENAQTEDFNIMPESAGCVTRFCVTPSVFYFDDILTFTYDRSLEPESNHAFLKDPANGNPLIYFELATVPNPGTTNWYTIDGQAIGSALLANDERITMQELPDGRHTITVYLKDFQFINRATNQTLENFDNVLIFQVRARTNTFNPFGFSRNPTSLNFCQD